MIWRADIVDFLVESIDVLILEMNSQLEAHIRVHLVIAFENPWRGNFRQLLENPVVIQTPRNRRAHHERKE